MVVELMDLPQEIIEMILSNLTHINDLLRAAQVCCKFYQISRRRLKPIGKLSVYRAGTGTCPMIECFQNVEVFPFSSLYMPNWSNTRFGRESAFWIRFGDQIHMATIHCKRVDLPDLVQELKQYFPNLRSLVVKNPLSDETTCAKDSPAVWNLPIEELCFDSRNAKLQDVMYLLRCSPRLRNLFLLIDCDLSTFTPHLLPYFEAIEAVQINTFDDIPNLASLPSKIIFDSLWIFGNDPIKIGQFFGTKRTIKRLFFSNMPTLEQIMVIPRAVSVKEIILMGGLPNFAGCLDVLAEIPGIKKIFIHLLTDSHRFYDKEDLGIDTLYPFYWSNQNSLNKFTELFIEQVDINRTIRYLADFSHITRISFYSKPESRNLLVDNDMQLILRYFPKLEIFTIDRTELTDAGLIGNGSEGQKSISCLKNFKLLDFGESLGITTASFGAFKFPKLEFFIISNPKISNVALSLLTLNAPNLKEIELTKSALDEEGLEFAAKNLPKLRKITFNGANMNEAAINSFKTRFPYLKIIRQ